MYWPMSALKLNPLSIKEAEVFVQLIFIFTQFSADARFYSKLIQLLFRDKMGIKSFLENQEVQFLVKEIPRSFYEILL